MPDDLYFKANGVKTSKIYRIKRYEKVCRKCLSKTRPLFNFGE